MHPVIKSPGVQSSSCGSGQFNSSQFSMMHNHKKISLELLEPGEMHVFAVVPFTVVHLQAFSTLDTKNIGGTS